MEAHEIEVAYRLGYSALPLKPIKLQIPGWAGDSQPMKNGSKAQPWHCLPWVEGSTYGLELVYSFDQELRISKKNGEIVMDPADGELPFKFFAKEHYGHCPNVDIMVPPGYVIRTEPHPRYFTDTTGTVPLMVPGHIQTEWWTRFFFVVFKAPFEGQTHVFRKGEGIGQFLIVPKKLNYKIREQTPEEANKRTHWSNLSLMYDALIGDHGWVSDTGNPFNDKYKVLAREFAKHGEAGIEEVFARCRIRGSKVIESTCKKTKKISKKLIKPKKGLPKHDVAQ